MEQMTNEQIVSKLNDINAMLCRYQLVLDTYLEAIYIVDQTSHPRMVEVVDGLLRVSRDVLAVKEAIKVKQELEDNQ